MRLPAAVGSSCDAARYADGDELQRLGACLHAFSTGRGTPARDAARNLVKALGPVSQDLRCEAGLEGGLEIAESRNGAKKQRVAFAESGSLEGVMDYLIGATTHD